MRPLVRVRRTTPFDPHFLDRSPLLWPLHDATARIRPLCDFPSCEALGRVFGGPMSEAPVVFERAIPRGRRRETLEPSMLYDGRIAIGRRVPTRANCWHDFLNALVWGTFPRSKQALHSRQHRAIAARIEPGARVLPPTRTRELDALALLDEGGVIVSADDPEPLKKALRFDTHSDRASASHGSVSTGVLRNAIASGQAEAIVFGHAIFESLVLGVAPAAVAAFVRPRGAPNEPLGALDRALADALGDSARFGTPTELCRVELNEVAAGAVISQRTR